MTQAAPTTALQELHALVAKSFKDRIEQDLEDKLPTDAATLGAAIKFLKDNNISADPANKDDLNELRQGLTDARAARAKARAERASNVIAMADHDLRAGTGQ